MIDGGDGNDTVFFWGEHDDFLIEQQSDDIIVTDLRVDGLEGRDVLSNVEYIEFFDGIAAVEDLFAATPEAIADTATTHANTATILELLDNDSINAASAAYSSVSITSGGGTVAIIGGEVFFDPCNDFADLLIGQSATVIVIYSFLTSGFQTATGTATITVTSRKVVWLFPEQLRFELVPILHRLQGRLAAQG